MTDDAYSTVDANRIKHLELIQGVVGRLANNEFVMKGWGVTLVTAILGFAVSRQAPNLVWVAVAPIALFSSLDAYFLWAERLFRALYEQVRQANSNVTPFFMAATSPVFRQELRAKGVGDVGFMSALRRPVIWVFHLGLLLAVALVYVALVCGQTSRSNQACRMRAPASASSRPETWLSRGQIRPNPSSCHRGTT